MAHRSDSFESMSDESSSLKQRETEREWEGVEECKREEE